MNAEDILRMALAGEQTLEERISYAMALEREACAVNRDDIVRMAREAGLCDEDGRDSDSIVITDCLERFANLVAAAERAACVTIVMEDVDDYDDEAYNALRARAFAILERGAP